MTDEPKQKQKAILINPFEDYAIVQQFYTDDGLFDGRSYAEYLMQRDGDRTEQDYADYDLAAEPEQ